MKRLFLLISLVIALYIAKPLWEESISKYVDVSLFEPVDEKVEAFLNSESLSTTVQYIGETLDKAVLFLSSKLTEKNEVASEVDKPSLTKPTHTQFSIYNIEIGTSKEEVTAKLGEPNDRSVNEYGTEWLTYHEEYHNYRHGFI